MMIPRRQFSSPGNKIGALWSKPYTAWIALPLVYAGAMLINKYTLAVLGFTYPTIFQGWQVSVGAVSLKVCDVMQKGKLFTWKMDKPGFISLFPFFMLFLFSIVSGSMALVHVPLPCFLAMTNLIPALVFLFDYTPQFQGASPLAIISSGLVFLSSLLLPLADVDMVWDNLKKDSPYFVALIHVLCTTCLHLYSRIVDSRFSTIDRTYYCYIVSAAFLAPASVYFEEALTALKFERLMTLEFIACTVASGFLGVFLQWLLLANETHTHHLLQISFSKIVTCLLSLWLIKDGVTVITSVLVAINILGGIFLQRKKILTAEEELDFDMEELLSSVDVDDKRGSSHS